MPPALLRVHRQWLRTQLSRLLANDRGDNEMIPEAVHRSPAIYL